MQLINLTDYSKKLMVNRPIRLAYLVTHPIQYQAPLLRRISQEPGIDLTVFFCSDLSVRNYRDPGFGRSIQWDVPLLDGYKHEFLPALGDTKQLSFFRPFNFGLFSRLRAGRFDVLWVHGYGRAFYWHAMIVAKILGIKVLLRDEANLISAHRGAAKSWFKAILFAGIKSICSSFLPIGSLNADYYRHYAIPEEKLFRVPYAVDNAYFQQPKDPELLNQIRKELGLDSKRPVILYASKFIHRKCPEDLLRAYFELSEDGKSEPNPYLLFVGDGELRVEVEVLAQTKNWHSIQFLGFKNQSELGLLYALCDVFVLPSVLEPWGLVVNEVMNAGKAVIVTDQVGCAPDLVKNGENGFVVPAHNIAALAEALTQATSDPERCRAMGRKSLDIINRWSFEEDVDGLISALNYVGNECEIVAPQ